MQRALALEHLQVQAWEQVRSILFRLQAVHMSSFGCGR